MDDRIHRALDGELPIAQLTAEERAELQRHRALIGVALQPIRRLPTIDVTAQVMRRVKPRRSPVRARLAAAAGWLWSPRPLTLRPAYALAGAFALCLVMSTSVLRRPTTATPTRVLVQFRLGAAQAREVALLGDFNGWRPEHRLHQVTPGVWAVDVELQPGVYSYVFMVDGKEWRLDPLAPRVTDGFGGSSSRVSVLAPERRS